MNWLILRNCIFVLFISSLAAISFAQLNFELPLHKSWFILRPFHKKDDNVKLYWLTADGLKADENLFNMFKWAQEGKLPNIKKLMDKGAYGYSTPEFPTLTSNNIASLHTGATAKVHGIVEGAIRVEGNNLEQPTLNGFSSASRNVDPSWWIMEKAGKKTVVLSVPSSTPPEISNGITIRGRWGNWGFDTPAVIYEPLSNYEMRKNTIADFYFNTIDKNLTRFIPVSPAQGWHSDVTSFSEATQVEFTAHGGQLFTRIFDSTDDGQKNYDTVQISTDKKTILSTLKDGDWSDWLPLKLSYDNRDVLTQAKIRIIKLWPDGRFRIRVLYNAINGYITQPPSVAEELTSEVGPMVDFLDNCLCLGMAPQLIVEKEDKLVALEEARMSWSWHKKAVGYILEKWQPDVLIEDFYTPNQMLVSRWWFGAVDPERSGFKKEKADAAWKDLLEMYKGVDAILGEALLKSDDKTLIVLSAQHGTAPLHRNTRINNFLAKKGWLKFSINAETGKASIDWKNSKVVYLKMAHIYINPNGLDKKYSRQSGPAYEALRNEVIAALNSIKDSNGKHPISKITKKEDAEKTFNLPTDRVGDLVLQATTGYRLWEEMTTDLTVFSTPLATGYKEGVDPSDSSVQTPFIIAGPGVKNGIALSNKIRHIDQLPTILKLMNIEAPSSVEGQVIDEIIQ